MQITKSTVYFQDGVRRIDYILAYKDLEDEDPENKGIREIFEDNLMKVGVHLERAPKEVHNLVKKNIAILVLYHSAVYF